MRRPRLVVVTWMVAIVLVVCLPGGASASVPGSQLWVQRYNGSARTDDGYALAVSPDGSQVFVTGRSGDRHADYATLAYDADTGAKIWSRRYDGPASGNDAAHDVEVSPDGSTVFVTGQSDGSDDESDFATIAYAASTGATMWVRRDTGGLAYALEVSPDGSEVFVTGSRRGVASNHNYVTVAYDASAGTRLWVSRYNGPGNSFDFPNDLGVSPDGSHVFVTGGSIGSRTNYDYFTIAYDATSGVTDWAKRYNRKRHTIDLAFSLAVGPHGSKVYVTGQSSGLESSYPVTVAYAASTGRELWVKRYADGSPSRSDSGNDIGVSPDGSVVFVTGEGGAHHTNYATVAFGAVTGSKLWASHYRGASEGSDAAYALGVSPDGSQVFVTGRSEGSTSDGDYATVAYGASTGVKLWASRYNGDGNFLDVAVDLGVSPDGSQVFVTGFSAGSTIDYATVSYRAA